MRNEVTQLEYQLRAFSKKLNDEFKKVDQDLTKFETKLSERTNYQQSHHHSNLLDP